MIGTDVKLNRIVSVMKTADNKLISIREEGEGYRVQLEGTNTSSYARTLDKAWGALSYMAKIRPDTQNSTGWNTMGDSAAEIYVN